MLISTSLCVRDCDFRSLTRPVTGAFFFFFFLFYYKGGQAGDSNARRGERHAPPRDLGARRLRVREHGDAGCGGRRPTRGGGGA